MNPEFPQNERARMEAKLTALLLGELHADEVAKLSQAMAEDPELAALYERLKVTIELVREVKPAAEEPAPLKLSAAKREKLLASFKTVSPQEFARPRRVRDWLVPLAACLVVAGMLVAMLLPALSKAKSRASRASAGGRYWASYSAEKESPASSAAPVLQNQAAAIDYSRLASSAKKAETAQEQVAVAPVLAPPASSTPMTIVLPATAPTEAPVQAKADGFNLNVVPMRIENEGVGATSQLREDRGVAVAGNGRDSDGETSKDGQFVFGAGITRDYSYSDLHRSGGGAVTNAGVAGGSTLARNGSATIRIDPDTHNIVVNADPEVTSEVMQVIKNLDRPKAQTSNAEVASLGGTKISGYVDASIDNNAQYRLAGTNSFARDQAPVFGDVPVVGRLFRSNSTVAASGGLITGLTRDDVGSLRYLTNGAVASAGPVTINGTPPAGDTNASPFLNRYAALGVDLYASNETHASHVAGVIDLHGGTSFQVQLPTQTTQFAAAADSFDTKLNDQNGRELAQASSENQNAVLTTRANQALVENQSTIRDGGFGGGGGGGGFGGGGGGGRGGGGSGRSAVLPRETPASGAKQVELAAAKEAKPQVSDDMATVVTRGALPSRAAIDGIKQTDEINIATLLQDGKGLYQSGRIDEAEAKFKEALNRNPNDQTALYYSSLAQQTQNQQVVDARNRTSMERLAQVDTAWTDNEARLKLPAAQVASTGSVTNGWYASPAGVRGFYDDNISAQTTSSGGQVLNEGKITNLSGRVSTNAVSVLTLADNNASSYFAAKEDLEHAKTWRQTLEVKTKQEEVDANLPRARMVTVMDKATPEAPRERGFGEKLKELFTGKVEEVARIQVEQDRPDINVNGIQGNMGNGYDPHFVQTEFETIQSHPVLERVVKQLNLDGGDPAKTAAAEAKLKKNLDLRSVKNTKFIEIGAKSETPEDAARIANAVAEAYRDYRSQEYEELKHGGIQSLAHQLAEQDKKIVLAQAEVDELGKRLGDTGPVAGVPTSTIQDKDTALPKPTAPPQTPQPEILTRENAFSTFSLNVSDVSFKLAAASLEKGQMPEPGSIRSEEFINAFDYRDPEAGPGAAIAFASERARYPFAHNRELLRFSLKTAAAGRQTGRALNIVLLLDNSGSMERADRVSIIREALRVLAGQLHAFDTFSVVTFARTAQLRVDGIPGNQAGAAAEEIAKLTPEGGTNLGEALELAYETARHHYLANGDNRVVLLTDGAANLGDVNADTLKQKVEAQRQQGIALDCFGIGWEGFNDDLLEVLTRNGDGRYGFINTPAEADTEFVAQIAGALHVAASDVKVQVEFNTNRVTSYRQIGYAKHQLTKEQFRDNTVDAAEIAAQEAGNALYTIETNPSGSGSIATVRVRYKVPGTAEYREQAWDVPYTGSAVAMDQASPAMRLASTACAFSEWLATSPFAAEVSTDELLRYMNGVPQFYGADARPGKLEWMIRQAKSVSGK